VQNLLHSERFLPCNFIENNNKVDRARAVSVPRIVRFRENKCPRRKREWLLLVLFKGTRRRPSVVHSASGGRESALSVKVNNKTLSGYIFPIRFDSKKKKKKKKKEHHQEMIDLCRRIIITFSSFSSFPWVSPFVVSQELVCGARRRRRLRRRRLV